MIAYDKLTWINNNLDLFHAVNLVIDETTYGTQLIGLQTDIGQILLDYINSNNIVLPVESSELTVYEADLTIPELIAAIQDAVQNLLDSKAHELNYDNGFAIASYVNSTVPKFRDEARRFIAWRDSCWAKCYEFLGLFESGEIGRPTVEQVLQSLPTLDWNENQTN